MRTPKTRREFLKATAAAAATLTAAGAVAAPARRVGETSGANGREPRPPETGLKWRFGGPMKETIVLDKPHIVTPSSPFLNSSGEIAGKRFVLDPRRIGPKGFPTGTLPRPIGVTNPLSAFGLLTLPPGSRNIRIVDCEFEGPWKSMASIPDLKPGRLKSLRGIDMRYASNIRIEGCSFDYLPAAAIYFYGCTGVEIEDVWSTNCTHIVRADWIGSPPNRYIRLNRLHHADGWGAADLSENPDYASVYESDRAIGANAVAGHISDSEISNLTTSGEVKSALKLVTPIRVKLDRIFTSHLMIQGTFYWNHSNDPAQGNGKLGAYNHPDFDEQLGDHTVDIEVTRSRFRPHQNAWLHDGGRHTVQLSYHQENVRFRECVFYKPDDQVRKRVAINVRDGVDVDIRDCLFVGWKKPADPLPPFPKQSIIRVGTYGKPGSKPAFVNNDFSRVNRFRP